MKANRAIEHSVEKERVVHLHEHEVLLSFNNDIGAELFESWWHVEGINHFKEWTEKNINDFI